MTQSTAGSLGSDLDPAREAQETNEDASILKRFKILGLVGTGNYARVYRVQSQNNRELAIKSINLSKTSDNYKQKFLPRELNVLRRVSHQNICKIHEIIQVADRVFIVMQLCPRGTIADLLHKLGPLSEPVARHLFAPVVDAVHYLHSLDFVHRDLKVENILLDQEFTPKLTDFSYSTHIADGRPRRLSKQTLSPHTPQPVGPSGRHPVAKLNETFCGTLPYLSPEMIRQSPYDSKKTDIWSLGVCLYVMLNDRLPFPFNDIKTMVRRQLTRDYKFKAHVDFSDLVRDLVGQMLEPEYGRRPSSLDVSRHPWLAGPREKPPH